MVMTSWPYVDQPTSDIEYSRLFREMGMDGVVGLGANASATPDGALRASATGGSMSVDISAGSALIRGYMFRSTESVSVTIEAPSTLARSDIIVIELNLSNTTIAERCRIVVVKGTPSGTVASAAIAPAPTQTESGVYQIVLATVMLAPNAIVVPASGIVDRRFYTGRTIGSWMNDSGRPNAPRRWQMGYNLDRGIFEYHNGTAWVGLGSWASISGKPTTFAPSAHTHSVSDITNLQTNLNAKANLLDPVFPRNVTVQGVLGANQFAGDLSGSVNGIKFFSGTGTPSGATDGDVWFSA